MLAQSPTPVQPTATIKNCRTQVYSEVLKTQTCSSCEAGYYLAVDSLSCPACLAGCASCSTGVTCAYCKSGFFLVGQACTACEEGCDTCTSIKSCSRCIIGYALVGASCGRCMMDNCHRCSSLTNCDECSAGYTADRRQNSSEIASCSTFGSSVLIMVIGILMIIAIGYALHYYVKNCHQHGGRVVRRGHRNTALPALSSDDAHIDDYDGEYQNCEAEDH